VPSHSAVRSGGGASGASPARLEQPLIRLLLIEEDAARTEALEHDLATAGFSVTHVASAAAVRTELTSHPSEIVLFDLDLPGLDGLDLLHWLRQTSQRLPILVVTAQTAIPPRVATLDAGADDYLVKPYAREELVARIRALLRRTSARRSSRVLRADELGFRDGNPGQLARQPWPRLSPKEQALLDHLLCRRDEVVTRPELLSAVFGYGFDPGTNLVDVHMAHLRRKLEGTGVRIETLRGIGFRLCSSPATGSRA
jgi:DNA-binding response OmpR family regulator